MPGPGFLPLLQGLRGNADKQQQRSCPAFLQNSRGKGDGVGQPEGMGDILDRGCSRMDMLWIGDALGWRCYGMGML